VRTEFKSQYHPQEKEIARTNHGTELNLNENLANMIKNAKKPNICKCKTITSRDIF
jgi:hypothetical protein